MVLDIHEATMDDVEQLAIHYRKMFEEIWEHKEQKLEEAVVSLGSGLKYHKTNNSRPDPSFGYCQPHNTLQPSLYDGALPGNVQAVKKIRWRRIHRSHDHACRRGHGICYSPASNHRGRNIFRFETEHASDCKYRIC